MTTTGLEEGYAKSKKYADKVLGEIKDILTHNNISFVANSKETEIMITKNKQTKKSINNTLLANISIPKTSFMILVDVVESGGNVFIRQKTK